MQSATSRLIALSVALAEHAGMRVGQVRVAPPSAPVVAHCAE